MGDFEQLRGQFKQAADDVQIGCAVAIGQKTIVSDSDKALRQSVEQKTTDELNSADGGHFQTISFAIFIPETHHTVFKGCEAGVGDSHRVGVAGQVFKDVLRFFIGFFYTYDPFVFIESVFDLLVLEIKSQFVPVDRPCEVVDELATKDH